MQPLRSLELTSALQKLIAIMQRTGFGKVCGLQLINGQPQFQPAPLVLQDWKLDSMIAWRHQSYQSDFSLKVEHHRLIEIFDLIRNGSIAEIQIRHGLPFRVIAERQENSH